MLRRSGTALGLFLAISGLISSPTTIVNTALADDSAADRCSECPTPSPMESGALPRAAVISGGVSLGAYQAGFLEYFLRYERANSKSQFCTETSQEDEGEASTTSSDFYISGASAGSITALLAGLRQCYEPNDDVEKELMFTLWKGVSLPKMLEDTKAEPDALVGKASIEGQLAAIQEQWDKITTWRPCSVYFGATVTRLTPRNMSISDTLPNRVGATVPKLTEKFLVHISTGSMVAKDEKVQRPVIRAIRSPFPLQGDSSSPDPRGQKSAMFPLLSSAGGNVRALEIHELLQLVQASSTFPVAFPPTAVPHRILGDEGGKDEQTLYEAVRFVDGGILGDNPLDLISYLFRLKRGKCPNCPGAAEPATLLYLDQDITGALQTYQASNGDEASLLNTYWPLLSNILGISTTSQLLSTFEQDPELRKRIETPVRRHLLTGEHLLSTSGFFDSSFMVYDYYQGMLAARSWLAGRGTDQESEAKLKKVDNCIGVNTPRYKCLLAVAEKGLQANPAAVEECQTLLRDRMSDEGRLNRNLFALTRTLANLELQYQGKEPPGFEAFMKALENDEASLPVLNRTNRKNTPSFVNESPFRTLELKSWPRWCQPSVPLPAPEIIPTLRFRGDILFEQWKDLQPDYLNSVVLETLGDALLNNALIRLPDRSYLAGGANTEGFEFRMANSPFNLRHFRGHIAVELRFAALPVSAAPEHHYFRMDPAFAAGVTWLPLMKKLPLGRRPPEFAALALTVRGVARTALMGSETGFFSLSPDVGSFSFYPELEVSTIVLDRLEPYIRVRLPLQGGNLVLPALIEGYPITSFAAGLLYHL